MSIKQASATKLGTGSWLSSKPNALFKEGPVFYCCHLDLRVTILNEKCWEGSFCETMETHCQSE